jgi:hypothetical protein
MSMETLVRAIVERPHEFSPEAFAHCGLQALIRVAQEVTPRPEELEQAVVNHHVRVGWLHSRRVATA